MTLRTRVLASIFRRNLASYFSGVLGYLFIVVFVAAGGAMAFNARFFTANEPNLDQLTAWFPLLLLFFVPAITMGVWADERKTGTDELLFTLPATDLEILLGKYLAVLAVYTVSLAFSMTHVLVLAFLGNPDLGLVATTYVGYWLVGAALLSAGMLASHLTGSMTVAFVLGVVLCGLPVFVDQLSAVPGVGALVEGLGVREQFHDFGLGILPLSSLVYFTGFTVLMLYLNHVLMTRRHWSTGGGSSLAPQYATRAVSLAVVAACLTLWAEAAAMRTDATSEQLFSLSPATRAVLDDLEPERPIEIQAFLSPEVPREYADTRKQLVGLLRQFDELGGKNLEVRYVDVEPFSEQAEEAEYFGIRPEPVTTERDGRRTQEEIHLGAVVLSSYDKVVVPFFGKGLPLEYELTRSVQTVASRERHTVGVLRTEAELTGGRRWRIVDELEKQYEVVDVSASEAIDPEAFDVLLAAMPSSLTDPEMDSLVEYVRSGRPALLFDDPFPLTFSTGFGVTRAPRQPKPRPGGAMAMLGGQSPPPPEPKADGGRATRLLEALHLDWQYDRVVFDVHNPHPEFGMLPAEYVFLTRDDDDRRAFAADSPISRGLQELIVLYSGTVAAADGEVRFEPLLTTGADSGLLAWEEFVDDGGFNFFTMQNTATPRRDPLRRIDPDSHVVAAHVRSDDADAPLDAVYVADVDMISDFFFEERTRGGLDVEFDNVTFVLNAVDVLAGDTTFVDLRSRRARHRTLQRVEEQKRAFLDEANRAELEADRQADEELDTRRLQLGSRVQEIEEDSQLDPIAKSQMVRQAEETEQQRFALAEAQIEQRKNAEIRKIRAQTNRQVRALESRIRLWAVLLPPVPALLVGLSVLSRRKRDERRTVTASREVAPEEGTADATIDDERGQ